MTTELATIDPTTLEPEVRSAMIVFRAVQDTVASMLGPANTVTLSRVWLHCVRSNETLAKCSQQSLAQALMTCAELNLMPGQLGHIYFLPFKGEVTTVVGYKGYLELARRSGEILEMVANVVYRDELESGKVQLSRVPAVIEHPFIPCAKKREDADIVAAYALVRTKDGGAYAEILDRWELDKAREASPAKNASSSPWKTHYPRMARKTAIRRLFGGGAVPMSSAMQRAYELDGPGNVIDAGEATVEPPAPQPDPIRAALEV